MKTSRTASAGCNCEPAARGVSDVGHLQVQRRNRAGGVIHDYRLAA